MYKRFIYGYDWKETGLPVYTGSSWDASERDKQHSRRVCIPFDKLIAEHGRESFTFRLVETISAKTKQEARERSVERENFWMHERKTWHECGTGGQNFMSAILNFISEDHEEVWRRANVAGSRRRSKSPSWRTKMEIVWEQNRSPERRAKSGARVRQTMQTPEWRQKHSARLEQMHKDPEHRQKMQAMMTALHQSPDFRAKLILGVKKRSQNPEWQQKAAAQMREFNKNPLMREKLNHGRWHVKRNITKPGCTLCCPQELKAA
jgi:hypothetical protein